MLQTANQTKSKKKTYIHGKFCWLFRKKKRRRNGFVWRFTTVYGPNASGNVALGRGAARCVGRGVKWLVGPFLARTCCPEVFPGPGNLKAWGPFSRKEIPLKKNPSFSANHHSFHLWGCTIFWMAAGWTWIYTWEPWVATLGKKSIKLNTLNVFQVDLIKLDRMKLMMISLGKLFLMISMMNQWWLPIYLMSGKLPPIPGSSYCDLLCFFWVPKIHPKHPTIWAKQYIHTWKIPHDDPPLKIRITTSTNKIPSLKQPKHPENRVFAASLRECTQYTPEN